VVRHHVVGRVQAQAVPGRYAVRDDRLARTAPAADPVDVPEPRPQRRGAGKQRTRPPRAYLTLIRVPSSAPSQIRRMTPAAATSNTCMVRPCSLASTNALVSMIRTPAASASS